MINLLNKYRIAFFLLSYTKLLNICFNFISLPVRIFGHDSISIVFSRHANLEAIITGQSNAFCG